MPEQDFGAHKEVVKINGGQDEAVLPNWLRNLFSRETKAEAPVPEHHVIVDDSGKGTGADSVTNVKPGPRPIEEVFSRMGGKYQAPAKKG